MNADDFYTPPPPPAFPTLSRSLGNDGMTLRDYFAAKAMQALLNGATSRDGHWEIEANAAYEIADAMMMKSREAK